MAIQSELLTGDQRHWWIGLTDQSSEGRWFWSYSLQVADFTSWGRNQPDDGFNGDFGCLYSGFDYLWSDESPTWTAYPICQMFAVPIS